MRRIHNQFSCSRWLPAGILCSPLLFTATPLPGGVDPTVEFTLASQNGDEGVGDLLATLTLSQTAASDVTVPFTVAGSATEGVDFTLSASPVTIPAGSLSADVILSLIDDALDEADETVVLTLGAPTGASLGATVEHTATINDDDAPPSVEFQLALSQAAESAGTLPVTVLLSGASGLDVTLPFTVAGSATDGIDFTVSSSPVTILAGNLSADVILTLMDDGLDEAHETVVLTLGAPTNAVLGATVEHTATINDDDDPPSLRFLLAKSQAAETAGVVPLTLQLSAASGLDVIVPFTHKGAADAGIDYIIASSPITILAGDLSVDLAVTLLDDGLDEADERVRVILDTAGLVNAVPGVVLIHRLTILDDDGPGRQRSVRGLRVSPASLDLPQVRVGEAYGPTPLVVENTQGQAITFTGVALEGAHSADYQVDYWQTLPLVLAPGESTGFDLTFLPTQNGPRSGSARVLQTPHGLPPGEVSLVGLGLGVAGGEVALNVGPDEFVDSQGRFWSADYGHVGVSAYVSYAGDIAGTDDEGLYGVARVGTSLSYAFALPDGEYDVDLHFAELEATAVGERVFDVVLEGALVVDDLDLIFTAGALTAWRTGALRVTVTGGSLELDLVGQVGEALLSAIEVRSVPVLSLDPAALDFGLVDPGGLAELVLTVTNAGPKDGHASLATFRMDGDSLGSGMDFYLRVGATDYYGDDTTIAHGVDLDFPAGQATPVSIFFEPTQHAENRLRLEFDGDFATLAVDLMGVGGAGNGWGYLHPVLTHAPALLVDFDQDGTETVELLGSESHTLEPGQSIAGYSWSADGGAPFSADADTSLLLSQGSTLIELTISDDKAQPDTASDSVLLELVDGAAVPGILCSYYDGSSTGTGVLLDSVPMQADYMERLADLEVLEQGGFVGASPYASEVMVRWQASFLVTTGGQAYEFLPAGGFEYRLELDGLPISGPQVLAPGLYDLEVRFAVASTAELPLTLGLTIDGQPDGAFVGGLTHSEIALQPVIHQLPTVGPEAGGVTITIAGFGFQPRDQVTVHWGALDISSAAFTAWTSEGLQFVLPPGSGQIQVTVETPGGLSNARDFIYVPGGPVPIVFEQLTAKELTVPKATTATWHPNGRLYVGTLDGFIYEVEFDQDWNATTFVQHAGISGLTNFDLLGIAVNPYDDQDPVTLYVGHGEHYLHGGGAFQGESPFTGQVSVLTGPDFDTPVPLVTQLPTSNHDHGINGLLFDNNGDLLICSGGNTNAGVKWPLLGDVPASPFSAAVVRAFTSRPDFDGAIQYVQRDTGVPSGDQVLGNSLDFEGSAHVEVFSAGLRNALDLVQATTGLMYLTDNGPNSNYGYASTGQDTDTGTHPLHDDELILLSRGGYYGQANRSRGFHDPRQDVWRDVTEASDGEFTQRIHSLGASTNGLDEYRAETFAGQLRGQLLAQRWNSRQYLVELTADGLGVVGDIEVQPTAIGLDVVTGPGGAILPIDYTIGRVRILQPVDAAAVGLTAYEITPWRTTSPGGTPFVIGGEGFLPGQTSVTVDGMPATLTSVSARRIRGVFPALATNNFGALYDVVVDSGLDQRVLTSAVLVLPAVPGLMKGFWRAGAAVPDLVGQVSCGALGTRMFLFGEGDSKTYAYDPLTGAWVDDLAPRPFPGRDHACAVVDGKVLLFGGLDAGSEGQVQIYDPVLDLWTLGASMPWTGGACSAVAIDGQVYLCGGLVAGQTVAGLSVYDPLLDQWDAGGALIDMPVGVNRAAAGTDGARLWVFGGRVEGDWPQDGVDLVQVYDPQLGLWDDSSRVQSPLSAMPLARASQGAAVWCEGYFHLFGGESLGAVHDEVQVYDTDANSWSVEESMGTARGGLFPLLFKGRVLVAGGIVDVAHTTTNLLEVFRTQ